MGRAHGNDATLQTKGVRALASGIHWPEDVQEKAGYSSRRAVELTKNAMASHGCNQELQTAALEALVKYIQKPLDLQEVASGGGEALVKGAMARFPDSEKVQQFANLIIEGFSGDNNGKNAHK